MDMQLTSIELYQFTTEEVKNEKQAILDETSGAGAKPAEGPISPEARKAQAYICLGINDSLENIVFECKTPTQAWAAIKAVFQPNSRARIAQLRRTLFSIKWDTKDSINSYISTVIHAAKSLAKAGRSEPDDEVVIQVSTTLL